MKYFDSHAHYYDGRFESECDRGVDQIIDALLSSTVSGIINVATSPETCRLAIDDARKRDNMYTALGVHPSDSQYLTVSAEEAISDIKSLIKNPQNKCIYYRNRRAFRCCKYPCNDSTDNHNNQR